MPEQNAYDSLIQNDTAQRVRVSMMDAVDKQPDTEAKLQGLAKAYGMPVDAVRLRQSEIERQARLDALDYDTLANRYPKTANTLANPNAAAIAHDDVDNMSGLERWAKYLFSHPDAKNTLMGDIGAGAYQASRGAAGVFQAAAEAAAVPFDFLEQFTGMGGNPLRRLSEGFAAQGAQAKAGAEALSPAQKDVVGGGVSSGVQSFAQNMLSLPLAFLPGGQPAALSMMSAQTGGQSYQDAREKGLDQWTALQFGTSQAVIEYATEKLPLSKLIGDVTQGAPLIKSLLHNAALEIPGEQVATVLQDMNEWAVLHPEKAFSDYLAERPSAAAQTLIATLIGVGGNVTLTTALQKAADNAAGTQRTAQQAEARAQVLGELAKLAEASKVRERDPAQFAQFMQSVVEEGVPHLYVDANALAKSVDLNAVAMALPSVAEQITQAMATGGDVVIPTQELLTAGPGNEFMQSLIDNARTTPEAMSPTEAREYMQAEGDQLRQDIDKVLAEREQDQTWQKMRDDLRAEFKIQLDQAKRFTSDVNNQYATLLANFYSVTAAKLGISPQELAQRYGLQVQAKEVQGGQQLDQGGTLDDVRQRWTDAGIDHAIQETGDRITVSKIVVPESDRGAGKGTAAMQALLAYADQTGKHVVLSPSGDFGGNTARLTKFYKALGFVENKGKNRAFSTSESMYRQAPGKVLQQSALPATIDIDGKQRPTTNSNGQPIAATEEGVRNFWKWFGDSKVVDAEGRPLVVYHGTTKDFQSFDPSQANDRMYSGGTEDTVFLTDNPDVGASYAGRRTSMTGLNATFAEGGNVLPVYLKITKPLKANAKGESWRDVQYKGEFYSTAELTEVAKSAKKDGMVVSRVMDYRDSGVTGDNTKKPSTTYAVFSSTQIKSAIGNSGEFDPTNPSILRQQARGSITLPEDLTKAPAIISLFKGADLSTFIHESGHFFLEVQADLAARIQAQIDAGASVNDGEREIVTDMNKLLAWFGVKGDMGLSALDIWHTMTLEEKRAHHEQFARGFEAYMFEGSAPSIELQSMFQKFRAWLVSVYKELKALNVTLTDDVRGVMDRMLASTQAIQEAEAARRMGPLFKTAEEAGMSLDEFAAYHALATDATQSAINELQARGLRDMRWLANAKDKKLKELQKEATELRRTVSAEVRAEVMSQPIYQAWQFLTGKGEDSGKFNTDQLKAAFGQSDAVFWRPLIDKRMTSATTGLHHDVIAEMFGFTSGDELIQALLATEPPASVIEGLTDQRMLERYGDLGTLEGLTKAADRAIHNEARARFVATEIKALETGMRVRAPGATGKSTVDVLATVARQQAEAIVARTKVRDLRPGQYTAAEARAARAAEKAMLAGKTEDALAEKRHQIINLQAAKATMNAQDEMDKTVKYLRKFDEKRPKGIDAEYMDQIDALLVRFDLAPASLKAIDKRKTLVEWVDSQREQGMEPDIPPELLNEALRKSYKDLTVEELRGLRDTVRQIEKLGRNKNKLLTAKAAREFAEVRDEIHDSIVLHAGDRKANTRTPADALGRSLKAMRDFGAAHIKAATYARVLDGGIDGGPVWEYLIRTANDRGDMETTMRAEATQKLYDILAPVLKGGKMHGKGQYFAPIKRSMNREQVIAMALNMGNESNIQRMLGGEGWTIQQVMPVVQTLTASDWATVQAVWDHFESYRPLIGAKEKRIYGKEPEWVEALPFAIQSADGVTVNMRGGYYPIKYDPLASNRAEQHNDAEAAKRQLQGAYTSATTRRGFTKARVAEVNGRPLLYSLQGVYSGVNDVIHDLAWHEWLIDANKILRSDKIDSAIREHYGPEVVRQFKTWVRDVATGEQGLQAELDSALGRLRHGVSIAGLGFNVMSAAMQPLGITQSIVRVGAKWVGKGMAQYVASPIAKTREVNAKSDFMANRSRTRFRELNEIRNQVEGEHPIRTHVGSAAYFLMMRCQQMVDTPTWLGAYEKAISEGNAEDRAIALADQAVIDAQGGGQTKDLAAIERGGPAQKLFTVFYSFMNTALNAGVAKTMTADTPAKKAKLAADYLMLYTVPAVLGAILKDALTPGDSGDWDEWDTALKKLLAEQIGFLFGLMVVAREFGEAAKSTMGLVEHSRDYSGPAGTRMISDTYTLGKQVSQGELDDPFRKAAINVLGDLFALPSAQINRTITGAEALSEGETQNPGALVFGYQKP